MADAKERAAQSYRNYVAMGYGDKNKAWEDLPEQERESWIRVAEQRAQLPPPPLPQHVANAIGKDGPWQGERQVDHIRPKHYLPDDPYEAIKVMEAWHGPEPVYWFCVLSAEKYQSRMGKKEGEPMARDAAKAAWYMAYAAKLRERMEKP